MPIDDRTKGVMLKALDNNLGYKRGEKVVIIAQRWGESLPKESKSTLDRSIELCEILDGVYNRNGVNVVLMTYVPSAPGSTINPTAELYNKMEAYEIRRGVPEIVIAPCGYSITHTDFRVAQNKKGSRFATMSNSSLAMFTAGGPFDIAGDYAKVVNETLEIAEKLRQSRYVRITGLNADLSIHIDQNLVHAGTGLITEPGSIDNWLGAEAYVVPVHPDAGGESHGWFNVPTGWGGRDPLKYDTMFVIERARFVKVESKNRIKEEQRWVDSTLKPMIFGKPGYDVLAELGIGTNPAISDEYLLQNWSIAVAEKKRNSGKNKRTVHLAHGNSKGMGGTNDVDIHQDFLVLDVDEINFIK